MRTLTHTRTLPRCLWLQVLLERRRVSATSASVIGQCASVVSRELLRPGYEFWSAKKTLIHFSEAYYFKSPAADADAFARADWPLALKRMLSSSTLRRLSVHMCDNRVQLHSALMTYNILYVSFSL